MGVQTKQTTSVSVREKNQELIKKHLPVFEHLAMSDPLFAPKMSFFPKGKDKPHIGMFTSEMQKGVDIFTEFVNREHEPEDPDRALWVWRHIPDWATQYDYIEGADNAPSQRRYLIPTSELVKVRVDMESNQTEIDFNKETGELHMDKKFSGVDDAPFTEMTIRDYVAIQTGRPVSHKEWLNKLISSK